MPTNNMSPPKEGRTTLEKLLLLLLFLTIGAIVALSIFIVTNETDSSSSCPTSNSAVRHHGSATHAPTTAPEPAPRVCTSPQCVTAASAIIQSLDESVSPCDDFYQFSCGKWSERHKIPEAKSRWSTFDAIIDRIATTVKFLLSAPIKTTDKDYIRKVKDYYAACMDSANVESLSSQPVKSLVQELGGWPLLTSNWTDTQFSLTDLLLKVNNYHLSPVIEFYVDIDILEPGRQTLKMDQPSFGLPGKKYYSGQDSIKYIKAYTELLLGVAKQMGATDGKTLNDDVADIVDFETKLANASVSDELRRDPNDMYNPMTLGDINGNYSVPKILFNVTKHVTSLMAMPGVDIADITESEVIINSAPAYFDTLKELLTSTPVKTLANYIVWRSVFDNIDALSTDYRKLYLNYNKVVNGKQSESLREDICEQSIRDNMGFAAGRMFLDEMFPADAKATANDMVDNITAAFNSNLNTLSWMDEKTKDLARYKNNQISRRIGYPDSNLNDTYMSEYYGSIDVTNSTFFQNLLNCKHHLLTDGLGTLRKPTDKTRWHSPPHIVNAYYNPDLNQITFPAGILQPPFFEASLPKYLNYGGMGMVIAHEITHGFDDQGRKQDADGKLKDWWTNQTSAAFNSRTQCIIDQYNGFFQTINGQDYHLNGLTTQGENIADNGGIKLSYEAYKSWAVNQSEPEPGLPGLNYSPDQLFFINFGQVWCGLERDEYVIKLIKTNPHPPHRFRVKGTVSNTKAFSSVFNCAADSNMNPTHKCALW